MSHRLSLASLALGCGFALLLGGCSPSEPSKMQQIPPAASSQKPTDKPVVMPGPDKEDGDGPPESELPRVLDIPLYPKAKIVHNKVASAGAEKRYHVTLETADPASKVAAFYSAHGIPATARGDQAQAIGQSHNGNLVIIDVDKKNGKTEIAIRVSPADTHG
ncbi:MAG TPA: hypothetical protein VHE55_12570 [Fimbriimonadaceae bacterium]|nr:hypothetical protein [Fimbriimonadaceae bacterium]